MQVKNVRDLLVWQRAMDLAHQVYQLVPTFPFDERYGLSSQLRRSAVSIPSNVAEGWGYGKTGRYLHHLRIARGSECELRTQLELAQRLRLCDADRVALMLQNAHEVGMMLSGLIRSLENSADSDS